MTTHAATPTVPDGGYFLHPDGSAWIYAEFRAGRHVGGTEEANLATHVAARDRFAGLDPESAVEVDEAVADAVVAEVMGPDTAPEMVVVEQAA